MQNGIIIQIKGLGVPVQVPTSRNEEGYEVRWSSDPEVDSDAQTHLLIGHDELKRFIDLAVDRRFVIADLISLTQVSVQPGQNSLSRERAIEAGVNPDNWDTVRVALVISGNSSRGPVMDDIEWIGSRQEYAEGEHLREAFVHATRRGIKAPSIFTHSDHDCGHLLKAAEFINSFRRQLKPSLRAADVMTRAIVTNLCSMDLTNINADRAVFYLREIQRTFIAAEKQKLHELEVTGRVDVSSMRHAQDQIDSLNPPQPTPRSSAPKMH
ncbi:hypothetical protein HMPREF1487_09337 [Pseudomonas sp. HPB0071]|uniref:Uncharacterized protein n=1 Tax=Pseudomonas luteola TaxID=47886 RepID=A0A2X2BZ40_PSELU|nr:MULTISPECIES: hypothetical protein [Pseudomonas]ENA27124.1 hypothetical protein HMPREF1487_09337 [Pseudomonas sp. HPB0071]MBA1250084.1 hypothetical protein [Pseudomonas zeshuii]MBH3441713.1 hypothetical protein [Pseudomonas luteola]SPZ00031.1 Uncharacterised protein [Pseudomonas luteola]